jgi:cation diffusion facilitator family transporter
MGDTVPREAFENYKVQRYIVALSGIILLTKFVAWYITGSAAIFTDALESIVNVAAGLMGLYALYLSTKPRDFDHPYGHGRAEYLSATVEGAMISLAGVVILIEAVRHILNPPDSIPFLETGMLLIAITAIANFAFGSYAIKNGTRNRSQALVASGKHLRSDAYSSFGIILGLLVLYILASQGHKIMWIDGLIAGIFGIIILTTGISVVKRSMEGIMDKVDTELLTQIVKTLNDNRNGSWIDIHNLKMVKYGASIHIDLHITMPWYLNIKEQQEEITKLIELIKKDYGEAAELSITSDPCRSSYCSSCKYECSERKEQFIQLTEWNIDELWKDKQHNAAAIHKEEK